MISTMPPIYRYPERRHPERQKPGETGMTPAPLPIVHVRYPWRVILMGALFLLGLMALGAAVMWLVPK